MITSIITPYRDAPFDIHEHHVLDLMVAPFVRFVEAPEPEADGDKLKAFVMDAIRGRWPVQDEEVLAAMDRVRERAA